METNNKKQFIDEKNFFFETNANFKEVPENEIKNLVCSYASNSGSKYFYTKEGVYRQSDHWGYPISSCAWFLDGFESKKQVVAFCNWNDFEIMHEDESFIERILYFTDYVSDSNFVIGRVRYLKFSDLSDQEFAVAKYLRSVKRNYERIVNLTMLEKDLLKFANENFFDFEKIEVNKMLEGRSNVGKNLY